MLTQSWNGTQMTSEGKKYTILNSFYFWVNDVLQKYKGEPSSIALQIKVGAVSKGRGPIKNSKLF